MDFKHLLVGIIIVAAYLLTPATASVECSIVEDHDCTYSVICRTYPGTAANLACSGLVNATFVLTDFHIDSLFEGVFSVTNFDGRVRHIVFVNSTVRVIQKLSFKYYLRCLTIDLSNTHIYEIQDHAFQMLRYLESLNLRSNYISVLTSETFYMHDEKVSNLSTLDLSHNKLKNLPSSAFQYLSELTTLYLNNNLITSITDDTFLGLVNLRNLYLHDNYLTSLNTFLFYVKSLTQLNASYNNISNISGYQLNKLSSLVSLNLSYNVIESIEINAFNQAFELKTLDLKCNKISSKIETVLFMNNDKLRFIDFYNNSISIIQENSFKYTAVEYINLEKNNISGEILENTLSGLSNVSSLNLSNQSITAVRNNAFTAMVMLKYLNLSVNHISTIENDSFINANSVTVLDLSYNYLSNVYFLSDSCKNLTTLNLSHNDISELPRTLLMELKNLVKLDLSYNKIRTLVQNSLPLDKLQYLNLDGNSLTGTLESNLFSHAPFLRYLNINDFKLQTIGNSALLDMPVLVRLNISNNEIDQIEPNNFLGMDNLYSLDLSRNKLRNFKLESALPNLKALYLNNNNISNLFGTFQYVTNITFLDISYNQFTSLSSVMLEKLHNLQVLSLSHNHISNFCCDNTKGLTKLVSLDLSSNQLDYLDLSSNKLLIKLSLSNNNLNRINKTVFEQQQSLRFLDISHNNITDIPPGTFGHINSLNVINVSSNHIRNIHYGSLGGLYNIEQIDMSRNSLTNFDVEVFHQCNGLKRLILDYNNITEIDINSLLNVTLRLESLSLGGNPISCKEIVRKINDVNIFLRVFQITSMDRIYHENNVYGIQCDHKHELNVSKTAKPDLPEGSISNLAVQYVSLTLFFIVIASLLSFLIVYHYKYKRLINRQIHMPLRSDLLDLNGGEY